MNGTDFYTILALAVPLVVAITLHEAAHGYAAWALGDDTAKKLGRLSLNPLAHVDLVGSIVVPGVLLLTHAGFLFGWAKPVPIAAWRFHDPRRGMMLVAAAGPAMNVFLAWLGALALHLVPSDAIADDNAILLKALFQFIVFNLQLGLFNLIPIPPLDGGRIAVGLLPERAARAWAKLERAGILIVLALLFLLPEALRQVGIRSDPLGQFLGAAIRQGLRAVLWLAGTAS